MHDRRLARHFERFRRHGDVAALGVVFDAVAPELARAASHLVREPAEVDDLIQATFLTAIEKAAHFDRERRLVPWLFGILVRHAQALRRERRRTPDPQRLAGDGAARLDMGHGAEGDAESDPERAAAQAEASAALTSAIRALPSRYRAVLEPFVIEGAHAAEIAARLGRSPGTVRMQQSRGLDLLRRTLPKGLALGLALEGTLGRGLAAIRAEVMAQAAHTQAATLAAGAVSPLALGTMTLSQKFLAGAAGVVLLTGLIAWATLGGADAPRANALARAGAWAPGAAELSALDDPRLDATPTLTPAGPTVRVDATADSAVSGARSAAEGGLATATGRVVEEDGTPVVGIAVELIAVSLEHLERAVTQPFEPVAAPAARVARAVTDAEGQFRLAGAEVNTHALIGIDLGGARPFARLVDEGLARGVARPLGDFVLPAVAPLAGRVVDARGRPVQGARVRVAQTESGGDWTRYLGIDADTPAHVGQGFLGLVIEPPPWFPEAERLLPVVATRTDADGRFEFGAAPREHARWFVDHPAYAATFGDAPPPPGDDAVRTVEVRLAPGRTLRGRVLSAAGDAAPGIEVRAGTALPLGFSGPELTPFVQVARTDAAGDFEVAGLAPDSDARLAVRARAGDPWTIVPVQDDGFQTLTLPARYALDVHVVDAEGRALDGATLALARPPVLDGLATGAGLLDPWGTVGAFEALGDGAYRARDIAHGTYKLHVRAEGFAPAEARVNARARMRTIEVTLAPPQVASLRLVDARSSAPIVGARVAVMERQGKERTLANATTDAAGLARLELPAEGLGEGAHLRVRHSDYGLRRLAWPTEGAASTGDDDAAAAPVELKLSRAGSLRLRLRLRGDGAQSVAGLMVELDEPRGADAYPHYLHRRFGIADADGVIEVDGLAPGPWRWRIFERYLNGDALDLLDGYWPDLRGRGDVEVRAGEVQTLDIELDRPGASTLPEGTGELTVRVSRDGAPVVDRVVNVNGLDGLRGGASSALDERGEALFAALPAGVFGVTVAESETLGALRFDIQEAFERVELAPGERRVLEFTFRTGATRVRVVDEQGAPAVGVEVSVYWSDYGAGRDALTDGRGVADLGRVLAGEAHLQVEDARFGVGARRVEVRADADNEFELPLVLGVPCAGEVLVPATSDEHSPWVYLQFKPVHPSGEASGEGRSVNARIQDGRAPFSVLGLRPGRYQVTSFWNSHSGELAPVEFELPQGGSRSLALTFVRQ